MTGRVYRIIHLESDICYIGSTANKLSWRWQGHKNNYRRWLDGKHTEVSIFQYFKTHGIDKFRIMLIKEYEVEDNQHLKVYEQLWMTKFRKSAVNKNNAFLFEKLSKKEYRDKHKEEIKAYNKDYYKANKERLSAKFKARLEDRTNCNCGGKYSAAKRHVHVRSLKHKQWLEEQSD